MFGLNTRSKRMDGFSLWNRAFEPMNVLLVVHGTVGIPPTCTAVQPAGSVPGATPSKFWEKIVVGIGVPVSSVVSRVAAPWLLASCTASSIGVPGAKPGATSSRNIGELLTEAPGAADGYVAGPRTTD